VLAGYRFYTTHNKGFAPLLRWIPKGSEQAVTGDIHLPSYPGNALRQSREWTPPGATRPLWLLLEFDEVILTPGARSRFRPPKAHTLVLREAERRFELQPGGRVELTQGTLHYLGLGSWMGYTVSYDWTRPWLIATSLVALFALGWHLWRRFFTRPWLQ
jgi:cytochrome c biogenesis protein